MIIGGDRPVYLANILPLMVKFPNVIPIGTFGSSCLPVLDTDLPTFIVHEY